MSLTSQPNAAMTEVTEPPPEAAPPAAPSQDAVLTSAPESTQELPAADQSAVGIPERLLEPVAAIQASVPATTTAEAAIMPAEAAPEQDVAEAPAEAIMSQAEVTASPAAEAEAPTISTEAIVDQPAKVASTETITSQAEAPEVPPIDPEAPTVSPSPASTSGATAGRGRGAGRGRARGKKRGAATTATTTATTSTTGAGRGRGGKRKSEAAALAENAGAAAPDTSIEGVAVEQPRKRRKAAMASRQIIESDEDDDSAMNEDPMPTPVEIASQAGPVGEPEQATTNVQVDQVSGIDASTSGEKPTRRAPARKSSLKVKLGFKRGSRQTESPAEAAPTESLTQETIVEPTTAESTGAPTADNTGNAKQLPASTSADDSVDQPQPQHLDHVAKKQELAEGAVPDLFGDDEPAQGQGPVTSEVPAAEAKTSASPTVDTKTTNAATKSAKTPPIPKPGSASSIKKSTAADNASAGKADPGKKSRPIGKTGTSLNKASGVAGGSGTPVGSSPGGSSLLKKRVPKPGVAGSSTPKAHGTPIQPPQAETSFLDALFADTIPQTEHERQLQREREERARKEQAAAAKAKKAKEDAADARRKSAVATSAVQKAAAAGSKPPTTGLVPAGGKPPPIALPSMKTIPANRQPGTSVLSRLGGSEKLRQMEIEKLRAESRQRQAKLAEVSLRFIVQHT